MVQKTVTQERTVLPPEDLAPLLDFSTFLENTQADALIIGPDGEQVPIPLEIFEALQTIVDSMLQKKAVTVAPIDHKLTTQAAADFLGMSRPTLIKLLESGEIPCEKLPHSRHRRILLTDLLHYRDNLRSLREEVLVNLVQEAEHDGLYDNEL